MARPRRLTLAEGRPDAGQNLQPLRGGLCDLEGCAGPERPLCPPARLEPSGTGQEPELWADTVLVVTLGQVSTLQSLMGCLKHLWGCCLCGAQESFKNLRISPESIERVDRIWARVQKNLDEPSAKSIHLPSVEHSAPRQRNTRLHYSTGNILRESSYSVSEKEP